MNRCPIGSYRKNGICVPIHRCPTGSHRHCQPIQNQVQANLQRLKNKVQDNELLKYVIDDYAELQKKLEEQQLRQQKQLTDILAHLQHVRETNFLTDSGLQHVEHEHAKLLEKLKVIREAVHTLAK